MAWTDIGLDFSNTNIKAQRFAASGTPLGSEFRVNAATGGIKYFPQAATDATGDVVVVWQSKNQDGDGLGVYGQRFAANGTAVGGEFLVNSTVAGWQQLPDIAMDSTGGFLVVWQSGDGSATTGSINGQRYNASGVAVGGELVISSAGGAAPSVAVEGTDTYTVGWTQDSGSSSVIDAIRFDSSGAVADPVFVVSSSSPASGVAVGAGPNGDVVFAYKATGGGTVGVFTQRYRNDAPPVVLGLPSVQFTPQSASPTVDLGAGFQDDETTPTGMTYTTSASGAAIIQTMSIDPLTAKLTLGFTGLAGTATVTVTATDSAAQTATTNFTVTVSDSAQPTFLAVGTQTNVSPGDPAGPASQHRPTVGVDAFGRAVTVYERNVAFGNQDLYGRFSNVSAAPTGSLFRVNTFTTTQQYTASVAVAPDGRFVVAWGSLGQSDDVYDGIYAQRYNADGTPAGSEFHVNTVTTGIQNNPSVAIDANGNFLVAWCDYSLSDIDSIIKAQRFTANGTPLGSEFLVNTSMFGPKTLPQAAMDAAGDAVIVWQSKKQDGDDLGIFGQRFTGSGVPAGGEFRVNTTTTGRQENPDVAMDLNGRFLVVWQNDMGGFVNGDIVGQRYDASGVAAGGETVISAGEGAVPRVAVERTGTYTVAWTQGSDSTTDILAARYNSNGDVANPMFVVSGSSPASGVEVGAGLNGDIVFAYNATVGGTSGVYTRRYHADQGTFSPTFTGATFAGGAQRSMVSSTVLTFTGGLPGATGANDIAGRISVVRADTGEVVPFTLDVASLAGGTTQLTLGFGVPSLANGVYRVLYDGAEVGRFHRLAGDINGDRRVDAQDVTAFLNTYGTHVGQPAYVPAFDLNSSGAVDAQDVTLFLNTYGVQLP